MQPGFRFVAIFALVCTLAACQAPSNGNAGSASAPMELKIYTVPAAQTGQLAGALGSALGKKANVTTPAPGKLLVYAPRDAQASIGAALGSLGKATPASAGATQVNLRFWIVDAQTGAGANDAALKPLSATLATLRQTLGPMHFQLEQAAAGVGSSGHSGSIATATPAGYQRTFDFRIGPATAQGVELTLDYQDAGPAGLRRFNTQVGAHFGDYLVLAQAPGACPVVLTSGKPTTSCPDVPALQLLIVRVDRPNTRA